MWYYPEAFRRKKWYSKSFIKNRFKLTENQIREAIKRGLVRVKLIPNPHGGASITLLHIEDVETNIEEIRKLPKYTKEERFRKYTYKVRGKLRWELGFWCPRCGRYVALKQGSEAFELFWSGEILAEDLRIALMIGHYIHSHIGRELIRCWLNEWIEEWEGEYEDYHIEISELIDEYCIEKAIETLIEDGMINGHVDDEVRNIVRELFLSPRKAAHNIEM